jgi:hypothetical protein
MEEGAPCDSSTSTMPDGAEATEQWMPATPLRKRLEWSSLRAVSFLRHGSGTSIFNAVLNDVSVVIKAPRYGISEEETRTVTAELLHEAQFLACF